MAAETVDRALLGLAMTTEDKLEERVSQLLVPLLNLVTDDTLSSTYKKVSCRQLRGCTLCCRDVCVFDAATGV